jgi:LPXTG-site transpeptidase (sortase) family protein
MRALSAVAVAAAALLTLTLFVATSVRADAPAPPPAAAATPTATSAAVPAVSPSAVPSRSPIPLAQLRISVPRLGIDLPLALGDIQRDVQLGQTPENVALLFPTTNVPGSGGNSYIYAHARNEMFLQLWNVKLGDRVRVIAGDGTHFDYAVTQIIPRVDPSDISWLDPTGPERITLQTSTGPNGSYPRFIAVADRVAQGD